MTTLVQRQLGPLCLSIVKGNGDWYMAYIGSVLALQVQKNEKWPGYFYKQLRSERGCSLELKYAMHDALLGLRLPEDEHRLIMEDFRAALARLKEAA